VKKEEIPQDLLDKVAQELMPLDVFLKGANSLFKSELDKLERAAG
jgi:hypothetical protein